MTEKTSSESTDSSSASNTAAVISPFLEISNRPTQAAKEGIFFDYNMGARVLVPKQKDVKWRICLMDKDTHTYVYNNIIEEGTLLSSKKYFVPFTIQVFRCREGKEEELVLEHEYTPENKQIVIDIPVGTLGDGLAWFPYVELFAKKHRAKVICIMAAHFHTLFQKNYPDIQFYTKEEATEKQISKHSYATYRLGLFFKDTLCNEQPTDFRFVGLHKTAAYILGLEPVEVAPRVYVEEDTRPIQEPYVCIAVQASTQCKYWNNPHGWHEVISFLKEQGYRVICIDRDRTYGKDLVWTHIPHGAEDQTGNRPLSERARWLKHAEFFIGNSSGLAWLAWGVGTRVVMISGFTHPTNEFHTPWRVINWNVCNSCWNDPQYQFEHGNFLWCPRHANTPRHFECSRFISGQQVIKNIRNLMISIGKTPVEMNKGQAAAG